MAEYIEREALLDRLEDIKKSREWDATCLYIMQGIEAFIRTEPAAAVQPIVEGASHDGEQDVAPVVHGEWKFEHDPINDPKKYFIRIVCSCCGLKTGQKSNYCPNCGCKMDGERKEPNV